MHARTGARHGGPRAHAGLVGRGHERCADAIARVMREAGIAARAAREFRPTAGPSHALRAADNILGRQFGAEEPNAAWVADVTPIPIHEGQLDPAVVAGPLSRMVTGRGMAAMMTGRPVWTLLRWRWLVVSRGLRLPA